MLVSKFTCYGYFTQRIKSRYTLFEWDKFLFYCFGLFLFFGNEMKAIHFWISWVLHGAPQYKAPQPRFSQLFWIDNYQKMDLMGNILKVGDEHASEADTYHSYGFRRVLWVLETRLEVNTWIFFTLTRVWHKLLRPIYYGCFLNISSAKTWRREVDLYPISELARPF